MTQKSISAVLVELGAQRAARAIRDLDPKDPITAAVLVIAAEAISAHGAAGFFVVKDLIDARKKGEVIDPAALRGLSLRERSDLLAAMEADEAGTQAKVQTTLILVADVLSTVGSAVVKGLLR